MLQGEKPNDFDLYFTSDDVVRRLIQYYRRKVHNSCCKPKFVSDNAVTLTDDVQLITRISGFPQNVITQFDFIHTNNYFYKGRLELNQRALESILAKELVYNGSAFPLCAMFRMRKFIKRGWTISAGEMLKIGWDISKLDLTDVAVLKQQLIGIDTLYFLEVLDILKKRSEDCNLDRTYVFNVIERVFRK